MYSRFTRTLALSEGLRFLRGAPGVTALKVPSTSDQPSPSFPKAIPLPEGPGLRTCASEQPFVTFGQPKVLVFELALLSDHLTPSSMLVFLSLEPCKRVREHFRGWGLDPKVQSPTVDPRGRGPKLTVRTRVEEEDCK